MEGYQSHNPNNSAAVAAEGKPTPFIEAYGDPKPPYAPTDVWVKEVNYSDDSQRDYDPMRISEEDCHSPKFDCPHNVNLSVRSPMEIFLSDIIICIIKIHMNSYIRANAYIFRDVSDSYICLLSFITWVLYRFRPIQTI